MDMKITTDLIKSIYERAIEATIVKFGKGEPDRIEIKDDGRICVTWIDYRWGEVQEYKKYISAEDLTVDMDTLKEQRLLKEKEDNRLREIYEAEQQQMLEELAKRKRHSTYLELKKEFES